MPWSCGWFGVEGDVFLAEKLGGWRRAEKVSRGEMWQVFMPLGSRAQTVAGPATACCSFFIAQVGLRALNLQAGQY
jgi:hypothetical protein